MNSNNSLFIFILIICLNISTIKTESTVPKLPLNSLNVPLFRQSTCYTCGVTSLQSILYYWQVYEGREDTLATLCKSTEDGTAPENIVSAALTFPNITAYMKENSNLLDLKKSLSIGQPVILDVQAWKDDDDDTEWINTWENGHYVVLIGMDDSFIYLMDPSTGAHYAYVPINEFLDRWHDYELLSDGSRKEYVHLAIFINGISPLKSPPPLLYMD